MATPSAFFMEGSQAYSVAVIKLRVMNPADRRTFERSLPDDAIERIADELMNLAALALTSGTTLLTGVSVIVGSNCENGRGAEVAVSTDAWALLLTEVKDGFPERQWCGSSPIQGTVDVFWDSPVSIPLRWFMPRAVAVAALQRWLRSGELHEGLSWSDDAS